MAERMSPARSHSPARGVALILAGLGGIATVGEIATALLARRGSVQTGAARHSEAEALTRAVITVERTSRQPAGSW